jgi:hypothetical protein
MEDKIMINELNKYRIVYQGFFRVAPDDGERYVHYDIIEAKSDTEARWTMLDMYKNCRRPLEDDDILSIALWKKGGKK